MSDINSKDIKDIIIEMIVETMVKIANPDTDQIYTPEEFMLRVGSLCEVLIRAGMSDHDLGTTLVSSLEKAFAQAFSPEEFLALKETLIPQYCQMVDAWIKSSEDFVS